MTPPRLLTLTLALVATAALTACTASAAAGPDTLEVAPPVDLCAVAAAPGPASDAVQVSGEVGTAASATFAAPLAVTTTERTVLVEGDGPAVDGGDIVDYALTVVDATTGATLSQEGYDDVARLPVPAATIGQLLGCAPVGSRVVAVVPETDQSRPAVWVLDIRDARPAVADGRSLPAEDGMPTVVLGESGAPTITVPAADPPAEVELAVLKEGDGAVVAAGESVLVQYSGVRWSTGEVFDASWSKGAPTALVTTEVIEGYRPALEGQRIGSQVLVVIPPAHAYGEGAINDDDLTGETLVFVVDLLAAAPAA